jgi:hypothetical protein
MGNDINHATMVMETSSHFSITTDDLFSARMNYLEPRKCVLLNGAPVVLWVSLIRSEQSVRVMHVLPLFAVEQRT